MALQNYSNHIRYYAWHHFVFYPLVGAATVYCFYRSGFQANEWLALGIAFMCISWLSVMLRQHYALINQNRTVRLEMRLRYYILTQQQLQSVEQELSFNQLAALRFASDVELLPLVKRTLAEKLTPDQIKKSIKNWQADTMRV